MCVCGIGEGTKRRVRDAEGRRGGSIPSSETKTLSHSNTHTHTHLHTLTHTHTYYVLAVYPLPRAPFTTPIHHPPAHRRHTTGGTYPKGNMNCVMSTL